MCILKKSQKGCLFGCLFVFCGTPVAENMFWAYKCHSKEDMKAYEGGFVRICLNSSKTISGGQFEVNTKLFVRACIPPPPGW